MGVSADRSEVTLFVKRAASECVSVSQLCLYVRPVELRCGHFCQMGWDVGDQGPKKTVLFTSLRNHFSFENEFQTNLHFAVTLE
jgi:hypothetical protein